jgi:hypothetical protein
MEVMAHRFAALNVPGVQIPAASMHALIIPAVRTSKQDEGRISPPMVSPPVMLTAPPVKVPDTQTIGPQMEVIAHTLFAVAVPDTHIIGPQMVLAAHK